MKLTQRGMLIALFPLTCQLAITGWLGIELWNLHGKLVRVSTSKEIISNTMELVRQVMTDYSAMNLNSENRDLYDPETTEKCCQAMRSRVKLISELIDSKGENGENNIQKKNLKELQAVTLQITKLLGWALHEQRQGRSHWVQVDQQVYHEFYEYVNNFLTATDNLIVSEQERASFSSELADSKLRLTLLLGLALPLNILISLLLGRLYSKSIRDPLMRIRQNSRQLALQKPLAQPLPGSDELAQLDKQLHQVARAVYERLNTERSLIANTSETICSLDKDGTFKRVNTSAAKLLSRPVESIIGQSLLDITIDEDQLLADEYLQKVRKSQEALTFELRVSDRYGQILETHWSALWSDLEQLTFCVVRDVTEERKIERLKQDFLDMISRDLKIPLVTMQGALAKVASGACGPLAKPVEKEITTSEKTITRLMKLVDNLLDFRRLEKGSLELDLSRVDLLDIAREAAGLVEGVAAAKGIKVVVPNKSGIVQGDRDKLLQTVLNFLSNAIKFSPQNGTITISLRSSGSTVSVFVRDEGPGIPAEFQKKVFEPFEQVKSGKEKEGVGLGLAICRMVVEAHHGQIGTNNADDGGPGAVFWISLPR